MCHHWPGMGEALWVAGHDPSLDKDKDQGPVPVLGAGCTSQGPTPKLYKLPPQQLQKHTWAAPNVLLAGEQGTCRIYRELWSLFMTKQASCRKGDAKGLPSSRIYVLPLPATASHFQLVALIIYATAFCTIFLLQLSFDSSGFNRG